MARVNQFPYQATAWLKRFSGGQWESYPVRVRVLAWAEGYAMVRRKGCSPFVMEGKLVIPDVRKREGRAPRHAA